MKSFALLLCSALCVALQGASAQTALVVPDTLSGPQLNLVAHPDSVAFFNGPYSHTIGYNAYPYLGPTLILQKGQQVQMHVNNMLSDTTTVHWHGLHVPAADDGGPHTLILAGQTWSPSFEVKNQAATYWYHPHLHGKTAAQAIKGAAGLIIVRDSAEAQLALPRQYGIDDFPIIVQSQQYNNLNQAMPLGMQDSTILVNGALANNGHEVFLNAPAQFIRLRLLNASGERVFLFGFSDNLPFWQIASDGGLLDAPSLETRIRLSPGERAEILIDLSGHEGQTHYLMSKASELPMGVQGGPTMPMPPGSPPMDSPLNGIDFSILRIQVVPATANAIHSIPSQLISNTMLEVQNIDIEREIRFSADSMMVMDGPFYFNDSSFMMDRIDFVIPVGQTERWKLVNETMVGHPFHLHDVPFQLYDRNDGQTPLYNERFQKDVVYLPMGDSLRFLAQFTDFSDTLIPYMFHCHILMHEDAGMMGQFLVVPSNWVGTHQLTIVQQLSVYPNPCTSKITVPASITQNGAFDYLIVSNDGRVVQRVHHQETSELTLAYLPAGPYRIVIRQGKNVSSATFVVGAE
ncbi:MAG: hypothetical protein RLZZ301_735 [Bacteroidota bacterium]|jgi:bilirubin oxidase